MHSEYFIDDMLGPFLIGHPFNRTKIAGSKAQKGYHRVYFSQVVVEAVFVWPQCFVGDLLNSWKHILGQLEQFCQSNWLLTRGVHCGISMDMLLR